MTQLPCDKCKGKCCTYPVFDQAELDMVRMIYGIPADAIVRQIQHTQSYDPRDNGKLAYWVARKDGVCPYLKNGACSIYSFRPKVCKDYGIVPELPCEYLYPELAKKKMDERKAALELKRKNP